MLFDDDRAECHCRDWNLNTGSVIGVSDRKTESLLKRQHGAEIHLPIRSGIFGDTVKHGEIACACTAQNADRLFNFIKRAHARGKDDRLALACDVAKERVVGYLTRGNLKDGKIHSSEQIDALVIEGARQEANINAFAVCDETAMSCFVELEAAQHLKL